MYTTRICFIFLFLFFNIVLPQPEKQRYRICVPSFQETLCRQMTNDLEPLNGQIDCIYAEDKIDCIEAISEDRADFMPLEPEEIYLTQKYYKNEFRIISEVRTLAKSNGEFRYEAVAVIRKSSNINSISQLRNKRSCHTGFGRNAGWKIPFSHLYDYGDLKQYCSILEDATTIERDLSAVSKFFSGGACAPGPWVHDKIADRQLKRKYSSLCQLCDDPIECSEKDKYSGYSGALNCLTEKSGDVAWTKLEVTKEFFKVGELNADVKQSDLYAFLCPNGTSVPIDSESPCFWAGRPWKAFIASKRLSKSEISNLQQQISSYKELALNEEEPRSWLKEILEITKDDTEFHTLDSEMSPKEYLNKGLYTITIDQPSCPPKKNLKFCVRSDQERKKCQNLMYASQARRIVPYFECVQGENSSDCIEKIKNGEADAISLSAKQAFLQGILKGTKDLKAVMSELKIVSLKENERQPFLYSLGLVRDSSNINTLKDLIGKKSCHKDIDCFSGWNIPLNVLNSEGFLSDKCSFSSFFNSSCIPGAKESVFNQIKDSDREKYCKNCSGKDPDVFSILSNTCSRDSNEYYYGELGALRCLVSSAGDIAFVSHIALFLYIDDTGNTNWGKDSLLSSEFQLICPNSDRRMNLENFQECNWGKIPSNKIYTRNGEDSLIEQEEIRLTLYKIAKTFLNPIVIKLFGSYKDTSDLLFEDSSVGFIDQFEPTEVDIKAIQLMDTYENCLRSLSTNLVPNIFIIIFFLYALILKHF